MSFLEKILSPYFYKKIDSVVLGCTHYPFVKEAVKSVFPYEVAVFDGGRGTAKQTKRRLEELNLSALGERTGRVTFLNSMENPAEISLCEKLFDIYKKNN